MKTYKATGFVLGNLWGGGEAAYPSEHIHAGTREELIKIAEKMLSDGSLDSGMGYERLIGAILNITETETIKKNGKEYTHNENEIEMIGNLNKKQQDFLQDCLYRN